MENKRPKHEKSEMLARSKLNSMKTISKTIQESDISETDYIFINDKMNSYCKLKKKYWKKDAD